MDRPTHPRRPSACAYACSTVQGSCTSRDMGRMAMTLPGLVDVSIAIPVYNGERYLTESLLSALGQTVQPRAVTVFDNCSTDRTVELARRLLPATSIRVAASNQGAVENFNRSLEDSQGKYFLWLAADDRLHPRHLERCLEQLERSPHAAACLPGILYIDPHGSPGRTQLDGVLGSSPARPRLRAFLRRRRWTEIYCLYRREALLQSPAFTKDYGTDVLLTWWFLLRGPLAVVEEPLLEYREFPSKSVVDMASSLGVGQSMLQWRKARLWRRLWEECSATDVEPGTRRIARQELVLCLFGPDWRMHLREDLTLALSHLEARGSGLAPIVVRALAVARHRAPRRRWRRK